MPPIILLQNAMKKEQKGTEHLIFYISKTHTVGKQRYNSVSKNAYLYNTILPIK